MKAGELKKDDYADFYSGYIKRLPNEELLDLLEKSLGETYEFFKNIPEEKLEYAYDEDKWTIKEMLQHLIDTERILSYRALRFARRDKIPLVGFDENEYAKNSNANTIAMEDLLEEYKLVRKSNILLFKNFSEETLHLRGVGNGNAMSVAAAGFIIVGHEMHHIHIVKERYL